MNRYFQKLSPDGAIVDWPDVETGGFEFSPRIKIEASDEGRSVVDGGGDGAARWYFSCAAPEVTTRNSPITSPAGSAHVENSRGAWEGCLAASYVFTLKVRCEGLSEKNALKALRTAQVSALEGKSAVALRILISGIEQAFADRDLEYVEALLERIDPETMPRSIWIGALRSTFRARENLEAWNRCLGRVAQHLALNGKSPIHGLPGLLKNDDRNILAIGATLL